VSDVTFHLTPVEVWLAQRAGPAYLPEAFEREGFIHCTDGEVRVLDVGNRYYAGDPRPYCVLAIDPRRVSAPIRYEDPERVYPHLHGPLETGAVVLVRPIERGPDGRFLAIGEPLPNR
jgi:uncharacterized protein (DUF952 family)